MRPTGWSAIRDSTVREIELGSSPLSLAEPRPIRTFGVAIRTVTSTYPAIANAEGMDFIVLDEPRTYRGRQHADVAMVIL
jgi:hypothetical protein